MKTVTKAEVVEAALNNWRKGKYAMHGICHCLGNTEYEITGDSLFHTGQRWTFQIINMLEGYCYVNSWLYTKHNLILSPDDLRLYREMWLEELLEYYKQVGE